MKKIMLAVLLAALVFSLTSCASIKKEEKEMTYVEKTVYIDSTRGDYKIAAVLTVPETDGSVPLVAILHGFAGDKNENVGFTYVARALAKAGIASIRMDFAGSGEDTRSFLEYTLDSAAGDVKDSLEYALLNANIDSERVGIFGYSNGGKIATMINAAEDIYKCRVLLAPAATGDDESDKANIVACGDRGYIEMPWYGRNLQVSREYYESVVNYCEHFDEYEDVEIPTLIIHGTEDTTVPSSVVDPFAEHTGADLLKICGADHGYGFYSDDEAGFDIMDRVATATVAFFTREFSK